VITGVDWPNALYFITCDGIAAHPFAVQLSNGKGSTPGAAAGVRSDRLDVALETAATGDLLNDGSAETAVLLSCSPQPSNGYVEEVRAFTSEGNFFGELPSPQSLVDPSAIPPAPVYIPSELSMQSGYLSAGMMFYGPGDSHATGPSIHRTITWKWDGESFTLACDG
jgi:hypothetical protein